MKCLMSEHGSNENVLLFESSINKNASLSEHNNNVDMNVLIDHPYCNQGNSNDIKNIFSEC